MKKIKAFTLAEVLITLAIIGVVAALTIPTVVTNYKTKALETQNKKAMSVLANGFRLLMAEDDVTEMKNTKLVTCENKACYANEIKRIFSVITDNTSENEIFNTKYNYLSYNDKILGDDNPYHLNYVFVTSDGMIFGLKRVGSSNDLTIIADINGVKNPNTGNQDLRKYTVDNNGKVLDQSAGLAAAGNNCAASNLAACTQEQCAALPYGYGEYGWVDGSCQCTGVCK